MIIQCPKCQSRYDTAHKANDDTVQCRCGVEIQIPDSPSLARSWHCPNCSGSIDPSKSRCDYCDAYIAFARCPACFSIAPYNEAKYCAECGELLTLPIKTVLKGNDKLPCPRCENHLKSKVVDSYLVDYCADCGGIWLSHHLLDNLLKKEPLNTTRVLGKRPSKVTAKKLRNEIRYLRCPECDATMNRRNFMNESGLILDECLQHGIWFDKYELAVALEYIRSTADKFSSNKTSKPAKGIITRRDETEVFEIKSEDLSLLLEEFPHWESKQ